MLDAARTAFLPRVLKRCLHADAQLPLEFSLVAALKSSATSLRLGEPLHAFALKSGLARSNLFVRNALLNLYAKCGRLDAAARLFFFPSAAAPQLRDAASWNIMIAAHAKAGRLADARNLFDAVPHRDRVTFTTMIMALAQAGSPAEALAVFRDMAAAGVTPNEVTLASVLSACSRLRSARGVSMSHAVAAKCGLDVYVLVATNLVHAYAVCSQLSGSRAVFDWMPEKNTITWNAMLNGYAKAGLIDQAVDLFERIPARDLVSWSTMIDGYLKVDRLGEALITYRGMLQNSDARPNEVLMVDLLSACGRCFAVREGQQLHAAVINTGLDSYDFMQATLIHFYGACKFIDLACLQFELGHKSHVSCWNALMVGLVRNNMVDAARELFDNMPERDVVSWSTLIAGYVQNGQSDLALELFREMLSMGFEPNEITLVSVLSAVASSGTLEQGKWIHDYILNRSIPLTDNLSAGLIDMYAKRGSIGVAMQVFDHVKQGSASASPWNTIICGLAMHGHADTSLSIFSDLQRRNIEPNSITFIGVLSACCHAGLVDSGRCYFELMRRKYKIEPTIKHYGCMIDLLGRAGCLEEAEQMIEAMPMKADVVIWGSMLAAARTHGNLEAGEKAAASLARLEPTHGAARVLLSNMYADAGRWMDVFLVRRAMQSGRMQKMPGCSGVL
ncbi:pentatricopeptide repeat-containing protein At5g19020, mitochondrial [Elaeis guineensis]|uniref:Pentatricopeptide repeat-containing protein At5g19020, mitochondrial n=1 Tax=Elaeis guineensis var. tenera TaxID=51953 RepID=A0A6I9S1T8_ELAGV|nr:pentatricopeptide repeat-containing protein At5g19020, mitochondrial [Elaeis guineensis]